MSIFGKIKKKAEDAGKAAKRKAEQAGKAVKNKAMGAEKQIKRGAGMAERAAKNAAHEAEQFSKAAEKAVKDALPDVDEIIEEVKDCVLDALEESAEAVLEELSGKALKTALAAAKTASPTELRLALGPVTIHIGDVVERIETIAKWTKNPPSSRKDLREVIETLAPTSVDIDLSVEVALVFVSSDALSVGGGATYETEAFLDRFDEILDAWGIDLL